MTKLPFYASVMPLDTQQEFNEIRRAAEWMETYPGILQRTFSFGVFQFTETKEVCAQCGTDELAVLHFELKEEVWDEAAHSENNAFLCMHCVAAKLGRRLTEDDFSDHDANHSAYRRYWRTL